MISQLNSDQGLQVEIDWQFYCRTGIFGDDLMPNSKAYQKLSQWNSQQTICKQLPEIWHKAKL